LDYITRLKGVSYIQRALNTKENDGIPSSSIQERKQIFGSNSREISREELSIKFSFDFWVLLTYATVQLVVGLKSDEWIVGLVLASMTLAYAVIKIIYLRFLNRRQFH
jgi:hypothetical protein